MSTGRSTFLRKFGTIVGYAALFMAVIALGYWVVIRMFTIRAIEVVGSGMQITVNNKLLQRTLLFFPSDKIRAQLLTDNPILADITFQKKYPGTLVIVAKLRTPVARLITPERTVLLDSSGIVLGDADSASSSLPSVQIATGGIHVGQTVRDARITQSLAFIAGMSNVLDINKITVNDDGSLHAVSGEINILFTQDAPITGILATLQTLLSGFRIKGTLPTLVDLRFDKPVVKY